MLAHDGPAYGLLTNKTEMKIYCLELASDPEKRFRKILKGSYYKLEYRNKRPDFFSRSELANYINQNTKLIKLLAAIIQNKSENLLHTAHSHANSFDHPRLGRQKFPTREVGRFRASYAAGKDSAMAIGDDYYKDVFCPAVEKYKKHTSGI